MAAEERARLLEFAMDNAADGMVIGLPAPGRHIIYVNDAFCRMTGYQREEVLGRTPDFLDGSETDMVEVTRMREAADAARPYLTETVAYRKDGSTFQMEHDVVTLCDGDGQVAYWYSVVRDVTERTRLQQRLVFQALHDALTGLPNRLLLADRLQQAILASQRGGGPVALFFMDLDGFKNVNDTYGHLAGDELLHELGQRLRTVVRESDTVSRIGGDEFALLLPGCGIEPARRAGEKILRTFARPFQVEGREVPIQASLGVAVCPEHGEDTGLLMRRADSAMYQAKAAKSGLQIFNDLSPRLV